VIGLLIEHIVIVLNFGKKCWVAEFCGCCYCCVFEILWAFKLLIVLIVRLLNFRLGKNWVVVEYCGYGVVVVFVW